MVANGQISSLLLAEWHCSSHGYKYACHVFLAQAPGEGCLGCFHALAIVTKALFLHRCLFASFLTIALQTKLVYLTSILEVLTRDLMEQCSNMQPKLMLRRTESVVEKLLTNWMSVCLSGFLRVSVTHTHTAPPPPPPAGQR